MVKKLAILMEIIILFSSNYPSKTIKIIKKYGGFIK
jgi:hypothetical protein